MIVTLKISSLKEEITINGQLLGNDFLAPVNVARIRTWADARMGGNLQWSFARVYEERGPSIGRVSARD